MFIQFGSRLLGWTYLAFGIIGFLPFEFLNPVHHEGVGARYLFNLVAINTLHNLIHLAVGGTALWASRSIDRTQTWGKLCGITLLVLFIVGMVQAFLEGLPRDQMFLGILPLNSPGHILHLVSGGVALYLGLIKPGSEPA